MRIDRVKLVAELKRKEMTQKHLAEITGISRATIGYIVGGKNCRDDIGHKIANALNLPIEKLLEK